MEESRLRDASKAIQWCDGRRMEGEALSIPHGTLLESFYGFPSFLFDMTDGGALLFACRLHLWRCAQGCGGLLSAVLAGVMGFSTIWRSVLVWHNSRSFSPTFSRPWALRFWSFGRKMVRGLSREKSCSENCFPDPRTTYWIVTSVLAPGRGWYSRYLGGACTAKAGFGLVA